MRPRIGFRRWRGGWRGAGGGSEDDPPAAFVGGGNDPGGFHARQKLSGAPGADPERPLKEGIGSPPVGADTGASVDEKVVVFGFLGHGGDLFGRLGDCRADGGAFRFQKLPKRDRPFRVARKRGDDLIGKVRKRLADRLKVRRKVRKREKLDDMFQGKALSWRKPPRSGGGGEPASLPAASRRAGRWRVVPHERANGRRVFFGLVDPPLQAVNETTVSQGFKTKGRRLHP